jgi:hypothetical protein
MTAEHDSLRDLLAAVALGAATPEEAERVRAHAEGCAVCREELDGMLTAASALALAVPQQDPPRALKGRIMDAVRQETSPAPIGRPRPSWHLPRPRIAGAWPALAAGLAAVAIGLLVWNITLQGYGGTDVTAIALRGDPTAAPAVRGQVLVVRDHGTAVIRLNGLRPLGPGRGYELWTIRGNRPESAGFLAQPAAGRGVAATADLDGVTALAVTPEPLTNTRAPTGAKIVVAALPRRG